MKVKIIIDETGRLVDVVDANTGEGVEGAFEVESTFPLDVAKGTVTVRLRRFKVAFQVKES